MIISGIEKFIEELKKINGKQVKINIAHKLYGSQTIEYGLRVLDDEGRLGFYINEQEIYLNKRDIIDYGMIKGMYFWADKLMKVEIQTT
jgi:hypothetical protein